MANVRLTWTLPTPTSSQRPLSHVRVEGRADGVTSWTEINTVDVPETELLLQDVAPGLWEFRGIVVDDSGTESTPLGTTIDVPFDDPSALTSFDAVIA